MDKRSSLRLDLAYLAAFLAVLAAFLIPRYLSQGTLFFAILSDPSGVHLYAPLQAVATELWAEGVPLWNPFAGCGAPHVACLQSSVFYPLNALFLVLPPIPAAELLIVLRLSLCGISCYVFGRGLSLSRGAALFLAIAFTTNNWELRFANLGNLNSDLLLPVTALVFLRAGETGRLSTGLWAVVLAALHVLGGMPESAFFAFGFVAFWFLFGAFLGRGRRSWGGAARKLAVLGGIFAGGALLSALQSLPFLEFLGSAWNTHGSGSTTYGLHASTKGAPAVFYPFQGLSPMVHFTWVTVGAVGFLFILRGLRRPLYGGLNYYLAAGGVLGLMKLFGLQPVQSIGYLPVIEMLAFPRYMISPLLFAWMVVATMGFEEWWSEAEARRPRWIWALGLPVLLALWYWAADLRIPPISDYYPWALLGITFAIAFLGWYRGMKEVARPIALLGAVVVLLAGEQWLHFSQIPADVQRFRYFYERPLSKEDDKLGEFIRGWIDPSQRMAFIGSDVPFLPQMMGPIRGFSYQDAICVGRYREYLAAAAGLEGRPETQAFPIRRDRSSSVLLDLASVRAVLLRGERATLATGEDGMGPLSRNGFLKWMGETEPRFISPPGRGKGSPVMWAEVPFSGSWRMPRGEFPTLALHLGLAGAQEGPVRVIIRCRPNRENRVLFDEVIGPGSSGRRLLTLEVPELLTGSVMFTVITRNLSEKSAHFTLSGIKTTRFEALDEEGLVEIGQVGQYTMFENLGALPRAYLAHEVRVVENPDAAIAALESPDFKPGRMVVLEEPSPIPLSAEPGGKSTSRLVEDGAKRVVIDVESDRPGILVLSDTYYPGWVALVDGVERPILPANLAFRAVPVEAGNHRVEFLYQPRSFRIGAWISMLTLLSILGLALHGRSRPAPDPRAA